MKISTIITTHNRSDMLREAIESVLRQEECGAETELIVVDDNSNDDTSSVIASYPNVKYLRTKQGTAAGSRNVGIEYADGDWVAFLDDDDVWLPRKLRVCADVIRGYPNARFVFSAATICDIDLVPNAHWPGPDLTKYSSAYDAFLDDIVNPSVVMVHKDVFVAVGTFDIHIPRIEDRELWYRITSHGFSCASTAESLVLYRLRASSDTHLLTHDFAGTMDVMRRFLAPGAPMRPAWRRRQQVLMRVRGWYAHQLLSAAQTLPSLADAKRLRRRAFAISPLHGFKWLLQRKKT